MKKLFPGFLAVLLAFCVVLAGCGGGGSSAPEPSPAQEQSDNKSDGKFNQQKPEEAKPETPAPDPQPTQEDFDAAFLGGWRLVAMEGDENDTSEEDIQAMNDAGLTVDLVFSEDGSCNLTMFGDDYSSGTWTAVSTTEAIVTMEGQRIDATIDSSTGRLRFYQGESALIFVRDSSVTAPSGNSGTAAPSAPAVHYDELDAKGNPTLYSVVELSGADLVKAIEDEGFKWSDDKKWWVSSDGNDCFYVSGNNEYEYLRNEITALGANGKGDSCVYIIVVDDRDYSSAEDAFAKLCNIEVLDIEWLDDNLGVAAVKGPSGATDIVLIDYNDEIGLYILNIFNEKAISSGLLAEYTGDDYGDTAAEVWNNLFGRSI